MADETKPLVPPSGRKELRPPLPHAATTHGRALMARETTTATNVDSATREMARPNLPARPATSKSVELLRQERKPDQSQISNSSSRPSLLSHVSSFLNSTPKEKTPSPPTFWTDHAHRNALLERWDAVRERDHTREEDPTVLAQLADVKAYMLRNFAELGAGEIVLKYQWMSYVLAKALRAPFCHDSDIVGRWEILAQTGGTRGVWGAW
ncbi:hypothetical protein K431DRAFT_289495 [Polychaeton citri CBS 116435]|uniref:Uncharacterized protein n=1 Tax=Polychaeton citri CBS 116435 TaxID=1314669 RepID=A0A9P4PYX9_9PEZI|nr:hypothetical protein K431DRAFT_289495 [Polychaeton citri CBS 116435]